MATIDSGDGYELDDFCENLKTEIQAWNAAALNVGGANLAFGSTGQRVYDMPQLDDKVGREQPIIYVEARGIDRDIFDSTAQQTGGTFQFDLMLEAMVYMKSRKTWGLGTKEIRDHISRLRRWLMGHGANGFCQSFACGKAISMVYESRMLKEPVKVWMFPVRGLHETTVDVDFS